MNICHSIWVFSFLLLFTSYSLFSQSSNDLTYASTSPNYSVNQAGNSAGYSFRHCKKLSATYSGIAIEVAISNFPLDNSDPIFRLYGNIHYYKHVDGWYSYMILTQFPSKEAAIRFLDQVIKPTIAEARIIEFKEGNRKVLAN